jgi:AcrR family transcriptional regulator
MPPMAPARRSSVDDSTTRTALLDAAQALMLEGGYAAVTTRRIAAKAGVNSALVYYYFDTMDGLFIALFRRGSERTLERLEEALASSKPLWGFWDVLNDQPNSALTMEFIALANHRKAIRAEIARYAERYRAAQLDAVTAALAAEGITEAQLPPMVALLMMTGLSQVLALEQALGVTTGHDATRSFIERALGEFERREGREDR